ncbi:MAG: FtsQ-type POTRA domain-containing protein [Patescibacteria group bacterium]|nr:FtsQ-type POTRA domain-containing protein [Patescibacteria group bacterium]MDE1946030.1 FtsQ-type POTRA domain-containing protein [Patescibacteria group bacterium]
MRQQSNINAILKRKKRSGARRKFAWTAALVFLFLALCTVALSTKWVRIGNVSVSGNSAVSTADIRNAIAPVLDRHVIGIVRTDNFFLLDRDGAERAILAEPRIATAKVSFASFKDLSISVTERAAAALWCGGDPAKMGDCFSMDDAGFVFASSSATSSLISYFGLLSSDPVGRQYFDAVRFREISAFVAGIAALGFAPVSFVATDAHEYSVYLKNGGTIIVNDSKPLEQSLANLAAVVANKLLKTDVATLRKIQYINLEADNKVYCAPAAVCGGK